MYQFSGNTNNFDFFGRNLPKNDFWCRNVKNLIPDLESALLRYHVCQFSVKTDNFDFFGPNLPKQNIQKTNIGIRISILERSCIPILRQNGQL